MEDAYRIHKGDSEFGWALLVKQVWRAGRRRRAWPPGAGASLEGWIAAISPACAAAEPTACEGK